MVDIGRKFASYAPDFTGPAPAGTAAETVLKFAHAASLENGYREALSRTLEMRNGCRI